MLLKTKSGQNLKKISIFFQSELKQKIWAWKYESDLARIQTLNLSKLWFGKFLKRLTFVQRTFWLPCSSPSLSAFQAQFFALTLSIAFSRSDRLFCVSLTVMPLTVFCGSCSVGSSPLNDPWEALKSSACEEHQPPLFTSKWLWFQKTYTFSQKSPRCDPIALLVRRQTEIRAKTLTEAA